jgi:hypothetical protein
VPVRSWPVRNLDSEFAEVDLATGAREASVILKVEQYRNNIVGDVENSFSFLGCMLVPGVACLNSNPRQNPWDVVYLLYSLLFNVL